MWWIFATYIATFIFYFYYVFTYLYLYVDLFPQSGLTPLHLAAQEDKVNVAEVLVNHGATIDPETKVITLLNLG